MQGTTGYTDNAMLLTQENIDLFRNRASHTKPIDKVDAFVGRVVAKKIVDVLFIPQLESWGFKATIPTFYDDSPA